MNSMLHSRYVATRLGVWRDRGKRLLETFIVKMGLPLAQVRIDYSSMTAELKESLPLRICKYAAEFGFEDVSFPSFVREHGYVMRLSASDAVYALMALLEAPYTAAMMDSSSVNTSSTSGFPNWVQNFYYTYDALDAQKAEKLQQGIQLAKRQQQVILHEATTILSHRSMRYGRRFRYVVLRHSADLAWLSNHPLSLGKLALFLLDATRTSRKGHLPLVLAAYQKAKDTFLVVATVAMQKAQEQAEGTDRHLEEPRNKYFLLLLILFSQFGQAFRKAAQLIRARVKHDGFESSMIEVKAEDLKAFLQTLQMVTNSS